MTPQHDTFFESHSTLDAARDRAAGALLAASRRLAASIGGDAQLAIEAINYMGFNAPGATGMMRRFVEAWTDAHKAEAWESVVQMRVALTAFGRGYEAVSAMLKDLAGGAALDDGQIQQATDAFLLAAARAAAV